MRNFLVPTERKGVSTLFDTFDNFFSPFVRDNTALRTDIKEYPSYFLLEIEIPGISKSNVDLTVENGYLSVSFTKTDKNDGSIDEWKYLSRERIVSATRSYYIGEVNDTEIKATYMDGVLYVHVPKRVDEKGTGSKKIEIH